MVYDIPCRGSVTVRGSCETKLPTSLVWPDGDTWCRWFSWIGPGVWPVVCQGLLVIRLLVEVASWVLVKVVISMIMIVVILVLLKVFQFLERYELILPLILPSWESFLHALGPLPWVVLGVMLGFVGCQLTTFLRSLNQIGRVKDPLSRGELKMTTFHEKMKETHERSPKDTPQGSVVWSGGLPGALGRMLIPLGDPRTLRSWGTRMQRRCQKAINACSEGTTTWMGDLRVDEDFPLPPGFAHLPPVARTVYLCMIVAGEEVLEAEAKVKGRLIPGYCWRCGAEKRNPEGLTTDGRCRLGCGDWPA